MTDDRRTVVLVSGVMDSATAVYEALGRGYELSTRLTGRKRKAKSSTVREHWQTRWPGRSSTNRDGPPRERREFQPDG